MKKFNIPMMMLIRLPEENIICASGCDSQVCEANLCYGFDCPDCPTICTGIYHCEVFKCTTY